MDMEFKYGKMELNMKVIGDLIRHAVMESFGMLMEMSLKESG
jgi:hypothetical protein